MERQLTMKENVTSLVKWFAPKIHLESSPFKLFGKGQALSKMLSSLLMNYLSDMRNRQSGGSDYIIKSIGSREKTKQGDRRLVTNLLGDTKLSTF